MTLFLCVVLAWVINRAVVDTGYALRGKPNPRYEVKRARALAAGQAAPEQPRYGTADWWGDLWADSLRANTDWRRGKWPRNRNSRIDDLLEAVREDGPAPAPRPAPAPGPAPAPRPAPAPGPAPAPRPAPNPRPADPVAPDSTPSKPQTPSAPAPGSQPTVDRQRYGRAGVLYLDKPTYDCPRKCGGKIDAYAVDGDVHCTTCGWQQYKTRCPECHHAWKPTLTTEKIEQCSNCGWLYTPRSASAPSAPRPRHGLLPVKPTDLCIKCDGQGWIDGRSPDGDTHCTHCGWGAHPNRCPFCARRWNPITVSGGQQCRSCGTEQRDSTPETPAGPKPADGEDSPLADVIPLFPNEKELFMAETTGLADALTFAEGAKEAHESFSATGGEGFLGALERFEVGDTTLTLAAEAIEASTTAAAKWAAVHEALEAQAPVREAYQANPDAGNKDFMLQG